MNLFLIEIFVLSQIAINLFECFVSHEHSVQTCFTPENQPAICMDPKLCSNLQQRLPIESLANCTETDKVCCPVDDGTEYRDAFIVSRWEWTDWFGNWSKPSTVKPSYPNYPSYTSGSTYRPIVVNQNVTGSYQPVYTYPTASPYPTNNPPTNTSISNPGCGGRNNVNQKDMDDLGFIVGGTEAPKNSWPWVVGVYSGGRFVCGACVIDNRYILCAAHCVSHSGRITKADQIQLLVGAHDRSNSGQLFKVEKIIVHSGYNERVMQNDISMFKLTTPITYGPTISPVCLPTNSEMCSDSNKQMVFLAGWGTTSAGGSTSNVLREVAVPVIPLKDCQRAYDSTMVTSKQICCGYLGTGGKDSCQGDSGGPMVVRPDSKTNKYFQCGIVSWGRGCAESRYPGVYTKVTEYTDWIRANQV